MTAAFVWDEMAAVGRIARAHGIKGQVVVNPETDFPVERFRPGAALFVLRNGLMQGLTLSSVRFHQGRPVVGVEGVETMTDAQALAGLELRIPAGELRPLPDGTFYHHDLVGCRVATTSGRAIGIVKEVDAALGASRLVVENASGDVLIPLVAAICTAVDVDAKTIVIDPPSGLLELNARSSPRAE